MVKKEISTSGIMSSQKKVWEQLKKIAVSNRLGSAYLFYGPSGSGKEYIATKFAQILNCESKTGSICRNCPSCKRSEILQHENINLVFPLPVMKKKSIDSIDEFEKGNVDIITDNIKKKTKDPFHKIQIPNANRILIQSIRVLRRTLYLKTQNTGRKMVLVFDAHLLNSGQGEAANAFLKILEEPPLNTTIVLITDYMELLLPTILSRCQKIVFPTLKNEYLEEWCGVNKVKKDQIPLLVGLCEGNVHKAKILISQPLDKTMSSISSLVKVIAEENPGQWRKFVDTYSKYSKQNKSEFYFHFSMIKIWFQAANRLTKNIGHVLHKTSFIGDMKIFIKRNPNADYVSIIHELEKPMEAVKKNYYIPLVLINILLEIQKHIKK
tara:strand:- start:473 stop:1615 length:1143 start_codon:yes stop_codon:yes gene_type:complete